ncbi:hypothetical protein [Hoyosella altamirensis]|uniref:Uncharacterized protein n=1 Tax=Hoyosella altamirensis TaxID=616997 RepID=A0A839RL35_9ACTN|nr:hypothetical protein [Hoyosella altamirensis]MBB3037009.1 hypothetical protein [Hoyosella altamirensis]
MPKPLHLIPPVVAGVALAVSAVVSEFSDKPNPFANGADTFGHSMLPLPGVLVTIWFLVAALGFLVSATALTVRPRRHVRTICITAVVIAGLLLDHSILMVLGYLPYAVVLAVTGNVNELEILVSFSLMLQILVAAGCVGLLIGLHSSKRHRVEAPRDTQREIQQATNRTRNYALIAIAAPLFYAASRILMAVEAPGFRHQEFTDELTTAGLGLAGASIVGAVLTLGLFQQWGERFPRWIPRIGGSSVPINLAVFPALVVAALIMAASRTILLQIVTGESDAISEMTEVPLVLLPHLLWPVWSIALAIAAMSYRRRRLVQRGSVRPASVRPEAQAQRSPSASPGRKG